MPAEYQIILPGCRQATLRLPSDLTEEDIVQIRKWIEFNESNLLPEGESDD